MSSTSHSTADRTGHRTGSRCGAGACWSGVNIAALVAGFVLFWPLGLFVLFWILSGREVRDLPDAIRRQWSRLAAAWQGPVGNAAQGATDNVVFNEYQQAQYERIREIKDEIRDRARRFGDFRSKARRRADEEEFDRFMRDAPPREGGPSPGTAGG